MARLLALLTLLAGAARLTAAVCPSISWTPAQTVATGDTSEVVVFDYDSDGKLDLFTNEPGDGTHVGLYTRRGAGNGTFEAPVERIRGGSRPALADITGDGLTDLVATGFRSLIVLPGTGSGFGTLQSYPVDFMPTRLVAGNFDGDGAMEVVVAGSEDLFVFFDNDGGQLVETQRVIVDGPGALGVADFDGDGHFDVVIPRVGPNIVSVFFRNANGTFAPPVEMFLANQPQRIVIGDIDNDGDPDFLVNDYAVRVIRIYRYAGSRQFTQSTLPIDRVGFPACCLNGAALLLQDLNADGILDLVTSLTTHASLQGIVTFIGAGDGTFRTPTWIASAAVQNVAAGDVDGDGAVDLVSAGFQQQRVFSRSCATQVTAVAKTPTIAIGQKATIEVGVSGFGAPLPATLGTITIDGVTAPVDASGRATLEVGPYALGVHPLTATFSGNSDVPAGTSASFNVTVVSYGTVAAFETSGQPVYGTAWPVTVTLTSNYSRGSNAYTFEVDGVQTKRTLSQGPAQLLLTPGPHTIRARYEGDADEPPSDWAILEVNALPATPSLTLHDSALAVRSGTAHVLHFTIAGNANTVTPTGTLQIVRDGSVIASATFVNGEATATLPLLPRGTYDVQALYSGDANFNATSVGLTLQVTPKQPAAIEARALTNAIQIGYTVPADTQSVTMFRRVVGTIPWSVAGTWSPATGLDTANLPRGVMHEYYLHAQLTNGTGVDSNIDRAMLFTDDPLAAGTRVKSLHMLELQQAINELRAQAGLTPFAFGTPVSASSPIRASHLSGLRTAVNQARSVLGWTIATFPPLTAGVTKILASDVQQLRDLAR